MEFLRDFKDIGKNDVALAGGKGASLGEMTQASISVPPGFVIISNAFENFLEETDLNVEIEAILDSVNHKEIHTVENASEKIKAFILQAEIPEDIAKEIQKIFKNLNSKYVAVRSSATAEDSASAAWAGQLDSFLNTTEENLLENIKKCWASLFTPRAIFYRFEKDLHKQKISVAVVVQKMVESEKSGIAFSVHPVTQDKNQLIIEAGLGLGEAIVSGQITPDSYVVEKQPRRIIDKNVQMQSKGLYQAKNGGNEWHDISKEQGEKQVLPDKKILELSEIILKIENHYGLPCDIEWAFEDGKFYILQSRPITTLKNGDLVQLGKYEEVSSLDSSDYVYSWGAKGFTILFQSMFHHALTSLPDIDMISINLGGELKVYWSKKSRHVATEYGKNIFNSYESAKKHCEMIHNKAKKVQKFAKINKIDFDNFSKFFSDSKEFIFEYITLDPEFTNEILTNSDSKRIISYLGDQKNELREIINNLYFTEDSVLSHITQLTRSLKDNWEQKLDNYTVDELMTIIKNDTSRFLSNRISDDFVIITKNTSVKYWFNSKVIKNILQTIRPDASKIKKGELQGSSVSKKGVYTGRVRKLDLDYSALNTDIARLNKESGGYVFVADHTTPELTPIMSKSIAIVTNMGGILSHAAITARELNLPCIVGTEFATMILNNNDLIEINADNGIIKVLEQAVVDK